MGAGCMVTEDFIGSKVNRAEKTIEGGISSAGLL